MTDFIKFILRKLLSFGKIRNNICYLRAFYFCKIKKDMKNLDDLANSIDLKMFYSKIISTTPPAEKLIYGATK